jgi:hypothetical protein
MFFLRTALFPLATIYMFLFRQYNVVCILCYVCFVFDRRLELRPCVVSLWFIDLVIITCWEKVGTTCVSAHTARIAREVIGLHLLAFLLLLRCQCASSRIQHFVPLGANATFQRFLNTAVGSTVAENGFPLINPGKRRFMYKPG